MAFVDCVLSEEIVIAKEEGAVVVDAEPMMSSLSNPDIGVPHGQVDRFPYECRKLILKPYQAWHARGQHDLGFCPDAKQLEAQVCCLKIHRHQCSQLDCKVSV